jgi:hypothetical protein
LAQSRKKKVLEEVRRRRQRRTLVTVAVVILLVGIIAGAVYVLTRSDGNGNPNGYPYSCLPQEALFLHIHPWLRITIGGVGNVTIPAGIGIVSPQYNSNGIAVGGTCFEPMHTHDNSGLVHIESPDRTDYPLGKFFEIWDDTYHTINFGGAIRPIVFNQTDILGYRSDPTHQVRLQVDGAISNAYGSLVLNQYDYCTSQLPAFSSPCSPTDANAQGTIGDPYYGGQAYPFGTLHTIVINYTTI